MVTKTAAALMFGLFLVCAVAAMPIGALEMDTTAESGGFIQIGEMHAAIGMGQHQGRVDLTRVVARTHFYGVGALEGLRGEITILDSTPIITGVTQDGRPLSMESANAEATMLLGQSVTSWVDIDLTGEVAHEQFEETVGTWAASKDIDVSKPFVFVIEGEFKDVWLHVINGACPVHARMKQLEIEKQSQPFELKAMAVDGTLVGVYATDSVGKLTHPATRVHAHLIYTDPETGERVTGHIERVGLAGNSVLKLPNLGEQGPPLDADESRR